MGDDESASAAGRKFDEVNLLQGSSLLRSSAMGEELLVRRRGLTSWLSSLIRMKVQEKRI